MTNVTQLLARIERGDPGAAEQLLPLVYDELRMSGTSSALRLRKIARRKPGGWS